MISTWLGTTPTAAWLVLLSGAVILAATIVAVRLNGLRTFSKMSSYDFPVTVAIGSVIATVTVSSTSLANGALGIVALVGAQRLVSIARRWGPVQDLLSNEPVLLLRDGELIPEHLRRTRVTEQDVYAKLREANCLRLADAHAVVLETTGDISVLHGGEGVDAELLEGVHCG